MVKQQFKWAKCHIPLKLQLGKQLEKNTISIPKGSHPSGASLTPRIFPFPSRGISLLMPLAPSGQAVLK
jgi:hypothetical protein